MLGAPKQQGNNATRHFLPGICCGCSLKKNACYAVQSLVYQSMDAFANVRWDNLPELVDATKLVRPLSELPRFLRYSIPSLYCRRSSSPGAFRCACVCALLLLPPICSCSLLGVYPGL